MRKSTVFGSLAPPWRLFSKNHDAKVSAPQLPFQKCLTLDYTSSRLGVIKEKPFRHQCNHGNA